ncbi:hypothetical protein EVU96_08275 [Bacillus infantis]|uniref:xylulokinase n=1 Tax=Bacillus infantis TaxID=324767 RepID=UPI00101CC8BC|nr:FGGY family carbohydrate kinase [Bacillus infantis]RYI30400.1 hypothetical protein EVU96_08275 [Bacillus infantis]
MIKRENRQTYHLKACLVGLDIGTSSVKGILMTEKGEILSRQKKRIYYEYPREGWVQFDGEQLYKSIVEVISSLVSDLPERSYIAGLSMAAASGNTMLINDRNEPLIPAISWLDARVGNEIELVFGKLEEIEVHEKTGWPFIPMFPLAHISWLKYHKPELLETAAKVCMSSDYINFRLTGSWGIDSSTATTFYLQDQKTAEWHLPFLQKLKIPADKLPPIFSPGTILGTITSDASAETGLDAGTPVVLGAFDHPSAARGTGIMEEGTLLLSCGTSWVGFFPIKDRAKAIGLNLLADPFLQPEGAWGAMFSLPAIAAKVDRYIHRYISKSPDHYLEFSEFSNTSSPGAGGLIINPLYDEDLDILDGYASADIARAVMEGTVFLLKEKLDTLEDDGLHFSSIVMVGGPSETHPWPQIVSDVLGKEIDIINGSSAGAAGAAILAGVGVGIYEDERDALNKTSFLKQTRIPDQAAHEFYKEHYLQFKRKYNKVAR